MCTSLEKGGHDMEKRLLQKGDVIRLDKGMKVYAKVPEKVLNKYRPFSTEKIRTDVLIGEMYCKPEISKHDILCEMMNAINSIVEVSDKQVEDIIDFLNLDFSATVFDSSIYEGEFIVDYIDYNGGWHVNCFKKDDPSIQVDFYQTGCFTAMIPDIEPINK